MVQFCAKMCLIAPKFFSWFGAKNKNDLCVAPIYGQARSPRPDGRVSPETPPKGALMGGACWPTPISKMTFPENLMSNKYIVRGGAI